MRRRGFIHAITVTFKAPAAKILKTCWNCFFVHIFLILFAICVLFSVSVFNVHLRGKEK